jgi:hypothetical protein
MILRGKREERPRLTWECNIEMVLRRGVRMWTGFNSLRIGPLSPLVNTVMSLWVCDMLVIV